MLTVYGAALSPFVRKVLMVLEYKGMAYDLVPVFPGSDDPDFVKMSPLKKIPAIDHDGFTISDSSVICRYLEQIHPDKPIYPADPKAQAQACWLEEFGDSVLINGCATIFQERMLKPKFLGQEGDEANAQKTIDSVLPPLLTYLESKVPEKGVLIGDHISIADISIITCFVQAKYGNYEVDASRYPKLRAYIDRCNTNEILQKLVAKEKEMLG